MMVVEGRKLKKKCTVDFMQVQEAYKTLRDR